MGFNQLKAIIERNKKLASKRSDPLVCPQCGYVPVNKNKRGRRACPMCEWEGS